MLTSNVKKDASIEFITQTKPHKVVLVLHDMVMFPAVFDLLVYLYRVTLTSGQLKIITFQLGTPEYHNLDTKTTKLTGIQLYLPILSVTILDLC